MAEKTGLRFLEGSRHTIAVLGTRKTTLACHPSIEMTKKTLAALKKKIVIRVQNVA